MVQQSWSVQMIPRSREQPRDAVDQSPDPARMLAHLECAKKSENALNNQINGEYQSNDRKARGDASEEDDARNDPDRQQCF